VEDLRSGGKSALIIVHLSSLDAFTDTYGFANGAYVAGQLFVAIAEHAGLVVVLDQGWPRSGAESDPRQLVLNALEKHPQVVWFPHTEDTPVDIDPWEQPMEQLGQLLRDHEITRVVLGGCFATDDDSGGCVNEVRRRLEAQGFVSEIDDDLCGFDDDEA
jgi:hypothetical protein